MKNEKKLGFAAWLEEEMGITWEEFDNNYDGASYDDIMRRYECYLEED